MDTFKHVTIPITLMGENYLLWARTTRSNLGGRGLWHHITTPWKEEPTKEESSTTEKDKDDDKEKEGQTAKEKWTQEDQVVLAALQNSLEASILQAYSYCEEAKELWDTLKTVYGDTSNLTRVFEIKRAINNLHMEDMDFKRHYGKFRSLWAELEMLRPHTIDPKELTERREQDRVFGLLLTLSHHFNDLVKHILRAKELRTNT